MEPPADYPRVVEYQPGRWVKITGPDLPDDHCQYHYHQTERGAWACTDTKFTWHPAGDIVRP